MQWRAREAARGMKADMVRFEMIQRKKSMYRSSGELSTILTITKVDLMAIASSLCRKNGRAESGLCVCLAKSIGLHAPYHRLQDNTQTKW